MIVDGHSIADAVQRDIVIALEGREMPLTLGILIANDDLPTKKFVAIKKGVAEQLGIAIREVYHDSKSDIQELCRSVEDLSRATDGVVVQLPFASHIDTTAVLNAVPPTHDIDVISQHAWQLFEAGDFPILPPVVGAIAEICKRYDVVVRGKHAVVVGAGRLVGRPAAVWLTQQGAHVQVVDARSDDAERVMREADLLILGAGTPQFVQPHMIKEGAVIFDAGTSEAGGKLAGDAHPDCASKASLFTPVPGGVGPITVAMVFKNLLELQKIKRAGQRLWS